MRPETKFPEIAGLSPCEAGRQASPRRTFGSDSPIFFPPSLSLCMASADRSESVSQWKDTSKEYPQSCPVMEYRYTLSWNLPFHGSDDTGHLDEQKPKQTQLGIFFKVVTQEEKEAMLARNAELYRQTREVRVAREEQQKYEAKLKKRDDDRERKQKSRANLKEKKIAAGWIPQPPGRKQTRRARGLRSGPLTILFETCGRLAAVSPVPGEF
ncbi:hypothetical protein B0H13DRAFT_1888167 [Mycena leptocephala]|nr:hypothetical protein B0H13DRAFT_1888167 [Mycena leptocephala]